MRFRALCLAFAWSLSGVLFHAGSARADDLADEADLEFRLGADAYQKGAYEVALEHFLVSNRLVPNRNVIYNIARSYEKSGQFPQAFRYFDGALATEPDPDTRARIVQELDRIRPHVAVLDVKTEPPGATLYVDREDLGPRGESPRSLGLPAGKYIVIAELPGYYPAQTSVEHAELGQTVAVSLTLKPILGTLRVEGDATGARVRIDDDTGVPRCVVPCRIELAPGPHVVHVAEDGHRDADVTVEVVRSAEIVVRPRLDVITGNVVVTTDEPGALVEVDGHSNGFTPVILGLPVGPHTLRISHRGFHSIEHLVDVVEGKPVHLDDDLTHEEEVTAASRIAESVDDAPSSVTIISRQEILAFGYPTIAEAVRGVPGMYVWNDRAYASVGARGLGRLGSYTNRELVLADGHPTNDDWIGSAYTGFDARTDLGDVDRIEVLRGPGSVLYGTNAFSGVINVVSRYKDEKPGAEVGLSALDYGVGRARLRAQASLGRDAGIWTSVSGADGSGRNFYFPELASSAPDSGNSRNSDGFVTGTLQGRVWWKWFTTQWFLHSQDKHLPTGEFDTLLGDPRSQQVDTRGFVEARAEPTLSKTVQLFSRLYWNLYRFRGDYARNAGADGGVEVDTFDGQWVGAEQRVLYTPTTNLRLTLGGEGQVHYRVKEQARNDDGYFLNPSGTNDGYRVGALYGLADASLGRRVRVEAGLRLDAYSTFGTSLNPRASVIVTPYEKGRTKFLVGKAFRAPSVYELYYNDGGLTQVQSPHLHPESIYSFEVEHSHRFTSTLTGTASVYMNYVNDLIVPLGDGDPTSPIHYSNSGLPLSTVGTEIGIRREWRQGWMLAASYAFQHSIYLAGTSASDLLGLKKSPTMRHVENSPEHLASFKAAAPLIVKGVTAATRLTFEGPVYDRNESVSDPPQTHTGAFVIWDLVLSGYDERRRIRYSIGAYNVTDWHYSLPVSSEFTQTTIVQNGRTFLASADIAF
ncbi:MAG TPA: TonB-dependent receptor [Polyangiaceae bacterium]|nr:TonB-dependent receptor [Polyangiaceae bacterium]